jgi:enterochelin esterase-like enzyme
MSFWNVNLTSAWFIAALAIVALACAAATTLSWEWQRLKLVRRLGGLLTTQLLVTATLAAIINANADFYTTPTELMAALGGGAPAPAVQVPTTYAGVIAADQHGPQPWERVNLPRQHGLIIETAIRGQRTGYDLPADIYLPGAYFNPHQRARRFPVLELTDGYPGSPHVWLHALDVVAVLNHLIATHRIPPLIAVLPTQNPIAGRDSECVDAVAGAQAGTYVGLDVPQAVAREFRTAPTRSGWGIMGYSTGGFCAVNTAIRSSSVFSAAASMSGYFRPLTDITTGNIYQGDAAVRTANTPMDTVRKDATPLRFYLFASIPDGHEVRNDQQFAADVRRPDTAVDVTAKTGGHNFQTWNLALPRALEWLGKQLSVGQPRDAIKRIRPITGRTPTVPDQPAIHRNGREIGPRIPDRIAG